MKTLAQIEAEVRRTASYNHRKSIEDAMTALTKDCYYGNNTVPRLTFVYEVEEEDGSITVTRRAPTIKEAGDILARAIADWHKQFVEEKAVREFVEKVMKAGNTRS